MNFNFLLQLFLLPSSLLDRDFKLHSPAKSVGFSFIEKGRFGKIAGV